MSPATCYYELGIQTKHVKLAVKIPDLRLSKIKLSKTMKKPRMMMRKKRRQNKNMMVDTSSLASLNIDWRQEFEEKYAELIDKTKQKNSQDYDEAVHKEKFQKELMNISLIANTSLLNESSSKDLSLNETCSEEDNNQTFTDSKGQRNLLKPKKVQSLRRLRYSYHILRNAL